MNTNENNRVTEYYRQRDAQPPVQYDPLSQWVARTVRSRDLAFIHALRKAGLASLPTLRALEIGCGSGGNLLFLLRLGFRPENLIGNDIVPDRITQARERLPDEVRLLTGSADHLDIDSGSVDLVLQSLVFSSILDDRTTLQVRDEIWRVLAPGGGLLWYDLRFDNPRNHSVRGLRLAEIKALFPEATVRAWSTTLAPPLSRALCRVAGPLYDVFNLLPLLRSHLVCWIRKP